MRTIQMLIAGAFAGRSVCSITPQLADRQERNLEGDGHAISFPGGFVNSEHYGAGAIAAAGGATAVGALAQVAPGATDGTALGRGAQVAAINGTALGSLANVSSGQGTAVGAGAQSAAAEATALGSVAIASGAASVAIGPGATPAGLEA